MIAALAVCSLAFAAAAAADEPDRSHQPAAAAASAWTPPTPARFNALGLDGYLVERHDVPIVELNIGWNVGSVLDPAGKEGMHALCTDLVGEATKSLDQNALADKKADIAASIAIGAGREFARMSVRVAKERLAPALDLAAQVLLEPALASADLERLRAQAKASVLHERGSADAVAGRVLGPVMFGAAHPYGHVVTEKSLDAITAADCASVAGLFKPDGAKIVVVGDVTAAEMQKLLQDRLAAWKGKAPGKPRIGPPQSMNGTIFFVDVPGAAQSRIVVGHFGPSRNASDYYATSLMAAVLGGGIPSRVVQNLRERNGYTYGARGGFNYTRTTSTFTIASSVRTDATGKALREVMNEMSGMTAKPPTDDEVNRERSGTIRALPNRFGTGGGTLGSIAELLIYELPLDTWQKLPADVAAVSTDKVRQAVKDHLRTTGLVVVVAGDKAKIGADLDALAVEGVFGKGGLVALDGDALPRK